jgi:cardiolipin synthase
MKEVKKENKNKVITLPNLLSIFRLVLVPVIIVCYFASKQNGHWIALIIFAVSALTDVLDGFIARKFNMITDIGKILDPIADKLTQLAIALCLSMEFVAIIPLLILLVIKDFVVGLTGLIVTRKSNEVMGAEWHGKLNTVLMFVVIALHLIWPKLPTTLSVISVAVSMAMMIITLILYVKRNVIGYKKAKKEQEELAQTNVPNLQEEQDSVNAN